METRLEADDGQIITSPGVPGEICGRGPQVMTLYFKEPDKTEEALKGGWFHSGDLGVLDEEGYVTVVDRKKDMIKTGGENVASREVEEAIYREPRVEEVAVIGLSHPKWIEAIAAVIVPKVGVEITEEEILAHCRRELAPFKVPKKIIFVEALPKTPTGKILKRQLRLTLEQESDYTQSDRGHQDAILCKKR
jgi:fatty-acyl-CoA synthase